MEVKPALGAIASGFQRLDLRRVGITVLAMELRFL
jgi:hypothetical protein